MHAKPKTTLLSFHRHARLIAWTLAVLAWLGAVFDGAEIMTRRRLRQRGGLLSLDWLARWVARLVLIRATELVGPRQPVRRHIRQYGVDLRRGHLMRSVLGSRLRRALQHGDIGQRIALLIGALKALDAWAARFAERLRRRITKLWAIVPCPCAADPLADGFAPALAAADTS